jgi:hypothetical protein
MANAMSGAWGSENAPKAERQIWMPGVLGKAMGLFVQSTAGD